MPRARSSFESDFLVHAADTRYAEQGQVSVGRTVVRTGHAHALVKSTSKALHFTEPLWRSQERWSRRCSAVALPARTGPAGLCFLRWDGDTVGVRDVPASQASCAEPLHATAYDTCVTYSLHATVNDTCCYRQSPRHSPRHVLLPTVSTPQSTTRAVTYSLHAVRTLVS
ncbi:hypothetical protein TREES_T100014973 [Tupaia chinensis]|uniref:Uncharacterized protein n=1 Tax=Tupaia chinensis TaxID=246437 RepID=L9KP93_TUPCH|nr:hypothetical protein TREES_T100014973 [Tupaia chinensis]